MGFYQDQIVPLLINWSMRQRNLTAYRSRIIPAAEGRVLEIGIGSGLSLLFYSRNVTHVIGLEPSPRLLAMARRARARRVWARRIYRGLGRGDSAQGRQCRYRRNDLDPVQYS